MPSETPPLGRRGYRIEDVDCHLDRVAEEIECWATAYAAAVDEIDRLRNYYREHDADPGTTRTQRVSSEAVTVLARAQAQADQLVADAHSRAQAMQDDAVAHAETIVAHARQKAHRVTQSCRAQAEAAQIADRQRVERLTALGHSLIATLSALQPSRRCECSDVRRHRCIRLGAGRPRPADW